MELYFGMKKTNTWTRSANVFHGLQNAVQSNGEILFFCANPLEECDNLRAAIWFYRQAGGQLGQLAVASPCPAEDWIQKIRDEGVGRFFSTSPWRLAWQLSRVRLPEMHEVPLRVCPSLHVRLHQGTALSVCGNRSDLMVLGHHHHTRWCFCDGSGCPQVERAAQRREQVN